MTDLLIPSRLKDLGGMQVGRVLPFAQRRMVGPFIFLDHIGPMSINAGAPRTLDVRPHPHIGLATITYLFAGSITHRDSTGVEQIIRPGEVNWMTAGAGITHSERFEDLRQQGGSLHGLQSWVALPESAEEIAASFQHHSAAVMHDIDQGVQMRIIAGDWLGQRSQVQNHSPLFYVHLQMAAGSSIDVSREYSERAIYVVQGEITMNQQSLSTGQMLVLDAAITPTLLAKQASVVMLLGGEAVGERHIWWNFVSSRKDRIEQAKADWLAQRFVLPTHDNQEFIPLPVSA